MSMLLVHELHEARDRILVLKQQLEDARGRELPAYQSFLAEQIDLLDEALNEAKIPECYRVAVVGRFKVGKSSFVNKLAGERLAGVHTNPETAAISVFRYSETAWAEVELISAEDWEKLRQDHAEDPKNAEVKRYERFTTFNERPPGKDKEGRQIEKVRYDLAALESKWLAPGGKRHKIESKGWETPEGKKQFLTAIKKFTTSREPLHYLVNKLTIHAPIPILRDQIELIDTPGLDDTDHFRVLLTEDLVKDVDAILYLTLSGACYGQSDKDFIIRQLRRRQIKHLQLIVTKADETYENSVRDANDNDEDAPSFKEFTVRETNRVREETSATLTELLKSNQLSDEDGYYFIQQLDEMPVHVISTKYHDEGESEKGGIDRVRDGLYRILSTSNRFEHSRTVLRERLEIVLQRLRKGFSERLNTLESEFDPTKVRAEIEEIRKLLASKLDDFGERSGKSLGLLKQDQEAFGKSLPLNLDVLSYQAKEILTDLEKLDLIKHWKTRRCGRWGAMSGLQSKIADRIFPKVEALLNELRGHLSTFMVSSGENLTWLQKEIAGLEQDRQVTELDPMSLTATQGPLFDALLKKFEARGEIFRDSIISNLDDFVTQEVEDRLDDARGAVTGVLGSGTTVRQAGEIASFYGEVRILLADALRKHLEKRFSEFAGEIQTTATSVVPRIRTATEAVIEQRLKAVESALSVASEGQRDHVAEYLAEMLAKLALPVSTPRQLPSASTATNEPDEDESAEDPASEVLDLQECHFEIMDGETGYTYERIFCPYLNSARRIRIEDPYIRLRHQIDNFARFCALAIRIGNVEHIELVTGIQPGESTDDADSRLETLRRDLEARNVGFSWKRDPALHDREIRLDNGWLVKIGRGLDIYHIPENWLSIEASDFSLRRCKQTKVDIFRE